MLSGQSSSNFLSGTSCHSMRKCAGAFVQFTCHTRKQLCIIAHHMPLTLIFTHAQTQTRKVFEACTLALTPTCRCAYRCTCARTRTTPAQKCTQRLRAPMRAQPLCPRGTSCEQRAPARLRHAVLENTPHMHTHRRHSSYWDGVIRGVWTVPFACLKGTPYAHMRRAADFTGKALRTSQAKLCETKRSSFRQFRQFKWCNRFKRELITLLLRRTDGVTIHLQCSIYSLVVFLQRVVATAYFHFRWISETSFCFGTACGSFFNLCNACMLVRDLPMFHFFCTLAVIANLTLFGLLTLCACPLLKTDLPLLRFMVFAHKFVLHPLCTHLSCLFCILCFLLLLAFFFAMFTCFRCFRHCENRLLLGLAFSRQS